MRLQITYANKFTYTYNTKFRSQRFMFCLERCIWRFMKLAVHLYIKVI